jgi:hypothetical protein
MLDAGCRMPDWAESPLPYSLPWWEGAEPKGFGMFGRRVNPVMNFFGDGPLGPWEERSPFEGEKGCAVAVIGFLVFLIVAALLRQYVFQ